MTRFSADSLFLRDQRGARILFVKHYFIIVFGSGGEGHFGGPLCKTVFDCVDPDPWHIHEATFADGDGWPMVKPPAAGDYPKVGNMEIASSSRGFGSPMFIGM